MHPETRFPQHGCFSLRRTGDVFVLDAIGPWNRETFGQYVRAVSSDTRERPSRWGGYVVVTGETLVTPDIVPLWRESNSRLASSGLVAVAYHFLDPTFGRLYKEVFSRALGEPPFAVRFVHGSDEAMAWLSEFGVAVA